MHKANLQPESTATAVEITVGEKAIRINGREYWLYAAVNPDTNETLMFGCFQRR